MSSSAEGSSGGSAGEQPAGRIRVDDEGKVWVPVPQSILDKEIQFISSIEEARHNLFEEAYIQDNVSGEKMVALCSATFRFGLKKGGRLGAVEVDLCKSMDDVAEHGFSRLNVDLHNLLRTNTLWCCVGQTQHIGTTSSSYGLRSRRLRKRAADVYDDRLDFWKWDNKETYELVRNTVFSSTLPPIASLEEAAARPEVKNVTDLRRFINGQKAAYVDQAAKLAGNYQSMLFFCDGEAARHQTIPAWKLYPTVVENAWGTSVGVSIPRQSRDNQDPTRFHSMWFVRYIVRHNITHVQFSRGFLKLFQRWITYESDTGPLACAIYYNDNKTSHCDCLAFRKLDHSVQGCDIAIGVFDPNGPNPTQCNIANDIHEALYRICPDRIRLRIIREKRGMAKITPWYPRHSRVDKSGFGICTWLTLASMCNYGGNPFFSEVFTMTGHLRQTERAYAPVAFLELVASHINEDRSHPQYMKELELKMASHSENRDTMTQIAFGTVVALSGKQTQHDLREIFYQKCADRLYTALGSMPSLPPEEFQVGYCSLHAMIKDTFESQNLYKMSHIALDEGNMDAQKFLSTNFALACIELMRSVLTGGKKGTTPDNRSEALTNEAIVLSGGGKRRPASTTRTGNLPPRVLNWDTFPESTGSQVRDTVHFTSLASFVDT